MKLSSTMVVLLSGFFLAACTTTQSNTQTVSQKSPEQIAQTYVQIAFDHINHSAFAQAKAKLLQAESIDNDNPGIYLGYGKMFEKEREPELAENNFKKAINKDNTSASLMYYALFLHNQGRFDEARQQFTKCTEDTTFPRRAECFEYMAVNELKLNERQLAKNFFHKATYLNAQMPRSYISLANLYLEDRDYKRGYEAFSGFKNLTLLEGNNLYEHSPISLWLGVRLAYHTGKRNEVETLASQLYEQFSQSQEWELYNRWVRTINKQ